MAEKPSVIVGTVRWGRIRGPEQRRESAEGGSRRKHVAVQPWIGYPICTRTAKKEILVHRRNEILAELMDEHLAL
ncbi:MAG: hypothetical protein ACE5HV_17905, partial [Acidobacteriota bacterium]